MIVKYCIYLLLNTSTTKYLVRNFFLSRERLTEPRHCPPVDIRELHLFKQNIYSDHLRILLSQD